MLQIDSSAPQTTVANKVAKFCAQSPKLPKRYRCYTRLSWRLHTFSTALTQGCKERAKDTLMWKKRSGKLRSLIWRAVFCPNRVPLPQQGVLSRVWLLEGSNKDQIYRRGILPSGKFKKLRSYHQTWRGTLNPRVLALHHSQMSKFNTMCATASYLHFQEKDCCKFSVKNRDLSIQYLLLKVVANIKRQKWLL